ncbi:MAG TPA: hypothetical protein VEB60_02325 [Candidatus Paceibacterota bacterium]|nr:hypothetical protein [Candidatus Paceibacterota bacterium]
MITKDQFLQSLLHDFAIIKHLYGKVPANGWDYRPTEKQRSTRELVQYLATAPLTTLRVIVAGDAALFGQAENGAGVTVENFPEMLDREVQEISSVISSMSDEDLQTPFELWGTTLPKGMWLLNMVLKNVVAYKMQLFLYAKAAGNADIGTMDLWQGRSVASGM